MGPCGVSASANFRVLSCLGIATWGQRMLVDQRRRDLKELDLKGTVAPELAKLRNLRSLIVLKNQFCGNMPKEISELSMLEILGLQSNNLSGTIPVEIDNLQSLKHLLLCGNKFNGSIPSQVGMLSNLTDIWKDSLEQLKKESSLMVPLKRKLYHLINMPLYKFGLGSFNACGDEHNNPDGSIMARGVLNVEVIPYRVLLESSNLAAAPISSIPHEQFSNIPSFGSSSFPAIPNSLKKPAPAPAPAPAPDPASLLTTKPSPIILSSQQRLTSPIMTSSYRTETWKYILILPASILILSLVVSLLLLYRKRGRPIGPWKTGLSGQLQKAFVTDGGQLT